MHPAPAGPHVVVRGEAVTEVLPDSADLVLPVEARDRRRGRALELLAERQQALSDLLDRHRAALGTASTDAVAVAARAPALQLAPAPQEVLGQVEVTSTMSVPDEEVVTR